MIFEATGEYKEVSLAEGLNLLQLNKASKLYTLNLIHEKVFVMKMGVL